MDGKTLQKGRALGGEILGGGGEGVVRGTLGGGHWAVGGAQGAHGCCHGDSPLCVSCQFMSPFQCYLCCV